MLSFHLAIDSRFLSLPRLIWSWREPFIKTLTESGTLVPAAYNYGLTFEWLWFTTAASYVQEVRYNENTKLSLVRK